MGSIALRSWSWFDYSIGVPDLLMIKVITRAKMIIKIFDRINSAIRCIGCASSSTLCRYCPEKRKELRWPG
jgi:hypothetical protein